LFAPILDGTIVALVATFWLGGKICSVNQQYGKLMNTHYILKAADGRMVTNDTQRGASLTKNPGLCYVWDSKEVADRELTAYQAILGSALTVQIHVPSSMLRSFRS
jgi:hypothetical protein